MTTPNKNILFPYILFGIAIIYIFLLRSCGNDEKQQVEVSFPAIVKSFEKKKPVEITSKVKTITEVIVKTDTLRVTNPIDKRLAQLYLEAKDSIEKLNLYVDAIKIREYNEKFDDENITIDIKAETTGTLNYLKPTYTWKEKKISVPVKSTVFAVYGGVGIQNTLTLDRFSTNAFLGFQNKRGDIFLGSYGTDKSIQIGYIYRFINFKK